MNIMGVHIHLIDFLDATIKPKFDEELFTLDGRFVEKNEIWKNIPVSKGKRNTFVLKTVPTELSFCKSMKIVLIQHENISSVIMLTIEIELMDNICETIKSQEYDENKKTLEKYQKELWGFWKKNISSTILIKNEITQIEPIAINQFKFNMNDYKDFTFEIENVINEAQDSTEIIKMLSKYGTNTLGLISVLDFSNQSLTIFSQNRALYRDNGFDYTGLILFDIKNTKWENDISFSFHKILSYQHYFYWLKIRIQRLEQWKEKLEKLSNTIRTLGNNMADLKNEKIDFNIFEQKALFQTEYASFMNEYREMSKYASNQLKLIKDSWWGEHIIKTEFSRELMYGKEEASKKDVTSKGIVEFFCNDILNLVEYLKVEFEFIKEQYKILGEELSEITKFANSEVSLQLAKESQNIQKTMKKHSKITTVSSVAVIGLTIVLAFFTIQGYNLANFDSRIDVNESYIVLKDSTRLPQFEYGIPIELSTMTSHHYRYTVSAVQDSIELQNAGKCIFNEAPEIIVAYPTTFFLSSGGDEKTIEPRFLLSSFPHYNTHENEPTVLTNVGRMQFQIIAEDLQDSKNDKTIFVFTDLNMQIPTKINTTELCKT